MAKTAPVAVKRWTASALVRMFILVLCLILEFEATFASVGRVDASGGGICRSKDESGARVGFVVDLHQAGGIYGGVGLRG